MYFAITIEYYDAMVYEDESRRNVICLFIFFYHEILNVILHGYSRRCPLGSLSAGCWR